MSTPREQVQAALAVINVVRDAIREAGPEGIASGPLYAMLMEFGCSLKTYEAIIGILIEAGVITRSNNLLTWKGGN